MNIGKLAKQAKKIVDKSGDKIAAGVDKATDKIDKKTGGKYHDKLEKVDGLASKPEKTKAQGGEVAADAATPDAAGPVVEPAPQPDVPPAAEPPTGTLPS